LGFSRKRILNLEYRFCSYRAILHYSKSRKKRGAKLLELGKDQIIRGLMSFLHIKRWANDKVIFVGDFNDSAFFNQVI